MNAVLGSVIGGLVAGAVAIGAAAVARPSPAYAPDSNAGYPAPVARMAAMSSAPQGQLQCEPYEEAVLRRAFVDGREVTDVTCITRMNYAAASSAYAQPMAYEQPQARDVVTRPVTRRVSSSSRVRTSAARTESGRSWAKTAMIIGGSTGGGAGLGGLIGGKKGALIGAAIGGGAATIYEARKR